VIPERVAYVCGVLVAVGELATAIAHAYARHWLAAGMWLFYALAAALLAFMK
jgi:hypothetical protein